MNLLLTSCPTVGMSPQAMAPVEVRDVTDLTTCGWGAMITLDGATFPIGP